MQHLIPRKKLYSLIHATLLTSLALPLAAQAQDDGDIEEVIVTGSYIRNSAFTQNSPVDTVTQQDLIESGAPNLSSYIRDLTYTQDTDVVSNLLAAGGQQGAGAQFNLRGLGNNSTLTLIDGVRLLNATLPRNMPEIAIERMEVVLDGGSALYGSDAVAGVVNIITTKEFDGVKARSYYQRTEDGAMEDFSNSIIWGRSFNNGLNYVGAFEYKKRTPLMYYERPREMQVSSTTAPSGNPGSFREVVNTTPGVNLYGYHGGYHVGPVLTDPSCGTFNAGYPEHGSGPGAIPSGHRLPGGQCSWEWTLHHQYAPEQEDFNLYNSVTIEANDWLRLNATVNMNLYKSPRRQLAVASNGGNDRSVPVVRADHPANPYGVDVTPWSWHVFADAFTHRPSVFDEENNRRLNINDSLNAATVSAEYDIIGSWTGSTSYSKQASKYQFDWDGIDTGKLQLGLAGMGGPNGDEYFNPFASADPRSPFFEEGVTDNSKEMTEWLWYHNKGYVSNRSHLNVLESIVTGDVYDLPAGTIQMALGYQWRDLVGETYAEPHAELQQGINYTSTSFASPRPVDATYGSEVHAYFAEIQVPILETLDAQLAVRNEHFDDFGLDTTTPKISLRWEALPSLALRGSWGESFLAPTAGQARPFVPDEACYETYTGKDPISGTDLAGGIACYGGNPSLQPETSTIQNIGFTWEASGMLDGFTLSLDYQEIEYENRIRSLSPVDTAQYQFKQMLAATGATAANYDPTPGSATRNAADAWLATLPPPGGGINKIARFPDGEVQKIYSQAGNISSVWINLFDVSARYTFNTQNWGSFTTLLQTTYYDTYEYADLDGIVVEAVGKQNARTGIVPPLPQLKANLRLSWFKDNQSATVSTSYWKDVKFDDYIIDYYADIRPVALTAPDKVKGEAIVNARYAIVLDQYFDSQFTLSAGINNVFDKRPQLMGVLGGFESRLSNNWGRQYFMSVEWNPGG